MKIFCVGIQGIGLSGVAHLLHEKGHKVSGVDVVCSDLTDSLKRKGISILREHKESNLEPDTELLIYSEAVPKNNPERTRAEQLNIKQITFAQSLDILSENKKVVAIAGTHGKTTITGFLTSIFLQGNLDPQIIIGSKMPQLNGQNYRCGDGDYFLVEACEYRRNFLSLTPHILLINSLEPDHLDYFADEADYISAYQELAEKMPPSGIIIMHKIDVHKLQAQKIRARIQTIESTCEDLNATLQIPGEHNRKNGLAAKAVAISLGIQESEIQGGLCSFAGTWRRLEHKGQLNGAEVYDDYAHHPKEIQATLQAIREKHPQKNIVAVFQPHQYNRTRKLKDQFAQSFKGVKKVYIPSIYKVRDTKEDEEAITAKALSAAINAYDESDNIPEEQLKSHLQKEVSDQDVVVVMGAGDITNFATEISKL